MGVFRDHPRRGAALLARVVRQAGFSVGVGAVVGFLLVVIAGVIGEEVFGRFDGDLDSVTRTGVGVTGLVILLGFGVGAFALGAERVSFATQLAAEAQSHPEAVPPRADRTVLRGDDPSSSVIGFSAIFLVLDVIALVIMAFAFAETARYNPEDSVGAIVIGITAGLGVATVIVLVVARKVWTPRWRAAVATATAIWTPAAELAATRAERAARGPRRAVQLGAGHRMLTGLERWGARAALALGAVGGVLFFIGLYTRQQCRRCEPVYYGEPIESAIDAVMLIAAPLIALALLLGLLAMIGAWLADVIAVGTLRRLAASGTPSPTAQQLQPVLTEASPATAFGVVALGVGWGLLPIAVVAASIVPGRGFAAIAAALAVVGALALGLLVWAEGAGARMRNGLRAAWSPGDPTAAALGRRRGSRRGGDADGGGGGD